MKNGIKKNQIAYMETLRESNQDIVKPFADKYGVDFIKGKKPWEVHCDIAIPSAIQNEINEKDAEMLVDNDCKFMVEARICHAQNKQYRYLMRTLIVVAPSKAVNAGGVAVSALEMQQNAGWEKWSMAQVDNKLRHIMRKIHDNCLRNARKYGNEGDYTLGANVGGFLRVANATCTRNYLKISSGISSLFICFTIESGT